MMALALSSSPSSCSYSSTFKAKHYHVFLSFRGEDTSDNFTSHLYGALRRNNIETFIDNDLNRGDEISTSLLKAIEESKIAIIVFSKEYASSRWCLEELAKIIERKNSGDLIVVPVFFHVDPSDVRKQIGTFGEAFVSHEQRFEQSPEKVQRWRTALTKTANISGFDSKNHRPEDALINAIVKDILKRLDDMSPSYIKGLVGIKSSIEEIESLLNLELNDVIIVGIWGMGGIGKTTLARAVFTKISSQFENKCFQYDIREESKKLGFSQLRQTLLSTILEDKYATLESTFTQDRLQSKKILLVLDDVSCLLQKEKLIGDVEFGPRSRIIITSRDQQVLKNFGVNRDKIYEVKALTYHDALTLFSRHAFKLNQPTIDYEMISKKVLEFAKGVPLALKVLGGLLLDRTITEWESTLHILETNSISDIQDVLKISYKGLDHQAKNIFLDIACFFKGANKNFIMEILNVPEIKISILNDKSLVTIKDNRITMHDLLQKMGWEIVEQESKDPGKRSRLWQPDHIRRVLRTNTGTEAVEGICLHTFRMEDMTLNRNAFLNMHKLKFFDFCYQSPILPKVFLNKFYCKCCIDQPFPLCPYCSWRVNNENKNKVCAPKGLKFASTEIMFFRWFGYPLKSLPSNFDPENLIALILPGSNIKQLFWKGLKLADKLKHINFMHSKHLVRIPDLSLTPNLKSLILEGCTSLIEVPSSIACLHKLEILNLRGCKSLSSLPIGIQSKSLTDIILSGCSNLKTAPQITRNMKRLLLDGTAIKELSVEECSSRLVEFDLVKLDLTDCSRLEGLPKSICMLKSLQFLRLSGCSRLDRLPNDLGNLEALEEFVAKDTAIREVPLSIVQLNKLYRLSLPGFKNLVVSALPISQHLWNLDLSNCQITKLPDNLFQLASLKFLNLRGNNFGCIPASIKNLYKLDCLDVSYCERLRFLPKLPSRVSFVDAYNCTSLEEIDSSLFQPFLSDVIVAKVINLGNCFKLDLKMLKESVDKAPRKYQRKNDKILYPGNEIPKWFSIQNMAGSSVSSELPLDCMKTRLSGFVWCVVLTFQATYKTKLIAKDKDGKWEKQYNLHPSTLYMITNDECCVATDHVLFSGYEVRLSEMVNDLGSFDFNEVSATIELYFEGAVESYEIKKCGIKLLEMDKQDGIVDAVAESSISLSPHEETEEHEEDNKEERDEPNSRRLKF